MDGRLTASSGTGGASLCPRSCSRRAGERAALLGAGLPCGRRTGASAAKAELWEEPEGSNRAAGASPAEGPLLYSGYRPARGEALLTADTALFLDFYQLTCKILHPKPTPMRVAVFKQVYPTETGDLVTGPKPRCDRRERPRRTSRHREPPRAAQPRPGCPRCALPRLGSRTGPPEVPAPPGSSAELSLIARSAARRSGNRSALLRAPHSCSEGKDGAAV